MEEGNGPTPVVLPATLPYPLTISRLLASPTAQLARGSSLFEYNFTSSTSLKAVERRTRGVPPLPGDKDAKEGDLVGTWDSDLQGELTKWEEWIKPGAVLERKHVGKTVLHIQQPCDHSIQFGGMCAICGTDLNNDDYLTRPDPQAQAGPSKKVFEMSHDAMGVTVSTNEAKRLETQSRDVLLSSRKLTLIVDLDQTIIHTTVDATVGEWMTEIEREKKKSTIKFAEGSTTPPKSPLKESNPFEEALQDVARFEIADDLPPGYGKVKGPTSVERWYYTKPRPGVGKFLQDMSEKYEMHVYTMGTRTYADAICKVVDPTGSLFGDRILSRDESGSFNAKDLKRLFPTDQSMVVVIDDRSDVWSDVPNLVKVVPYTFFQGTGDVNSAFLPPLPKASPIPDATSTTAENAVSTVEAASTDEGKIAQAKMLDEQSEARPLAKLQAELDEKEANASEVNGSAPLTNGNADVSDRPGPAKGTDGEAEKTEAVEENPAKEDKSTTPPGSPVRARKTVLNLYDDELDRIAKILRRIHHTFYQAYETRRDRTVGARLPLDCDVTSIIPEMKATILDGCHIVFSGIIPRHVKPQNSLEWQQAEAFGAECQLDINPQTTHCVIRSEGTEKAYKAASMGKRVVLLPWFEQSIALWKRVDETPYLAHRSRSSTDKGTDSRAPSGSTTPKTAGLQLQSDGEPSASQTSHTEDGADEMDGHMDLFAMAGLDDDEEFLASIRAEAGIGDDESDFGGTEDTMSRHVPSSPTRSILASPRGSRAGSAESEDAASVPGTPRKRVRYADEESLPLESFKDPSPDAISSPPRKRPRALLMPPGNDSVPSENRFQWKDKKRKAFDAATLPDDIVGNGTVAETEDGEDGQTGTEYEPSEVETEEDELAAMLRETMEDDA